MCKIIASTLTAWVIGLVLDGNIGYGESLGFTNFRTLFPILAIGLCILSEVKKNITKDK